ncbi:anion transporter [Candidatus Binatia bacterium]|nr:anion transporter [Candidatus Binatia bacterium]
MDPLVIAVFAVVYLGMVLGGLPRLAIDRTGIAVLGAIVLVASGRIDLAEAWRAIDVPTIALLVGLMVVSAQLRLGGFYGLVTRRLARHEATPDALLAVVIGAAGVLSALLVNDIVCLAMAPVLVEICARRELEPRPFLLALACAANVGSAATLIGNPQNMLIGQALHLSFAGYLRDALPPTLLGLVVVWWVVRRSVGGRWAGATAVPVAQGVRFDRWQTTKGLVVLAVVIALFVATPWPRDLIALAAAGVLLVSRRTSSRATLGQLDGQLLLLFIGLFVVNHTFSATGVPARALADVAAQGIDLRAPGWLFALTVLLSNLVSNVPAVMLLLPAATHPQAGAVLALASTLAGNLLVVGSIANIIVVEQAARLGVAIDWRTHARVGVPVTLATLAVAAAWLWVLS